MEKWSDLEKWSEEVTNKHIIDILKESEYMEPYIYGELEKKNIISKNLFNNKKREK